MGQRVRRKPGGVQEWVHILALVQLAGNGVSVVIDPLRCPVDPLSALMAGPVRKVFLGGGQDAALLRKSGVEPINVVDVGEVALSLFGRKEDGMAALASRIFGMSLDKTVRRADWMTRPLNPALLAYAHQDAELTLDIYRWMAERHTPELRAHERRHLDPGLSEDAPEWLRQVTSRGPMDPPEVLKHHGLDRERDAEYLMSVFRNELSVSSSPRLVNRLLRAAGDLELRPLLEDALTYRTSHSSLVRSAVARAIGRLAETDQGLALLDGMVNDASAEVKNSVAAAVKDLKSPKEPAADAEPDGEADTATLGDDAMAALARLRDELSNGEVG